MSTLTFSVPNETAEQLNRMARELGIPEEELLHKITNEYLARTGEFQSAAGYVLQKNTELYQRLAK